MKASLFILYLLLVIPASFSQEAAEEHDHNHDHISHGHFEMKNEVGGAIGAVFMLEEQGTSLGFHLHYYRRLPGKMKRFGISPGRCIRFW